MNPLKVIQYANPVFLTPIELQQMLRVGDFEKVGEFSFDRLTSELNNALVFRDELGIYYQLKTGDLVHQVCGRYVDEYRHEYRAVPKPSFIQNGNMFGKTYLFSVQGEYDVPGTAGEKTRRISGKCLIEVETRTFYTVDGEYLL